MAGQVVIMLVAGIIGFTIGLVGLIPPLRRAARASQSTRLGAGIAGALIVFLAAHAIMSSISANAIMVFGLELYTVPGQSTDQATLQRMMASRYPPLANTSLDLDSVQRELFLRELIPMGSACHTTPDACAWADYAQYGPEASPSRAADVGAVIMLWLIKLLPAVVALGVWLWITRQEQAAATTPQHA